MASGFDPAAAVGGTEARAILNRARIQAERYEARIAAQKDSINRLLKDGTYDTEMGNLFEIVGVQATQLSNVREALRRLDGQASPADGDNCRFAISLIREALDASTED